MDKLGERDMPEVRETVQQIAGTSLGDVAKALGDDGVLPELASWLKENEPRD